MNSTSSSGSRSNGANTTLTAANVEVCGNYSGVGFSPVPTTGVDPADDPLAALVGAGLTVLGGGTIIGDEVMFYNTDSPYAPISFSGNAVVKLAAPRSGIYSGVLFYTDRNISGGKANQITGTSDSFFTGAMYFPTTPVTFIGNTNMKAQKTLIIADTVEFQGNCTFQSLSAADGLAPMTLEAHLVY